MISAFGVEHGEISKGLPSALRGAKSPNLAMVTGRKLRAVNRVAANSYGKQAAKYMKHNPDLAARSIRSGKDQREYSRRPF